MADLDLPRGPLTQHLTAMHNLLTYTVKAGSLATGIASSEEVVAAHAAHARAVAQFTQDRPKGGPTPPRPDPITRGETRREGWDFLVCDQTGTVLAGWTDMGHFHAWAPTEQITRVLCDTVMQALHLGGSRG